MTVLQTAEDTVARAREHLEADSRCVLSPRNGVELLDRLEEVIAELKVERENLNGLQRLLWVVIRSVGRSRGGFRAAVKLDRLAILQFQETATLEKFDEPGADAPTYAAHLPEETDPCTT